MDPGKNKNKSYWNQMKLVPLCQDRHTDSVHILFFRKWTPYVKVIAFWSISQTSKKVNSSNSIRHTIDVSSTSTWSHHEVSKDMWQHEEVTCVTHFWNFQAWCGLVKKVACGIVRRWHMALYRCNMWPYIDVTHGSMEWWHDPMTVWHVVIWILMSKKTW